MCSDIALCAVSGERPAERIWNSDNDQPDQAAELAAARRRIADLERTLNALSGFTPDDNLWMQRVAAAEERELDLAVAVSQRDAEIGALKNKKQALEADIRNLIDQNTSLRARIAELEPESAEIRKSREFEPERKWIMDDPNAGEKSKRDEQRIARKQQDRNMRTKAKAYRR